MNKTNPMKGEQMKNLIAIALILVGSTAWGMTNMPDGVYQGQGRWQDGQGQTGRYNIITTVQSNVITSTYTFGEKTKIYEFEAKAAPNSRFDVYVNGDKAGEGYCMSIQCHYEVSFEDTVIEETLTFYKDNLYRIGSKLVDGKNMTWEESLQIKEN